jgi:hypothetical protein
VFGFFWAAAWPALAWIGLIDEAGWLTAARVLDAPMAAVLATPGFVEVAASVTLGPAGLDAEAC